MLDFYDYDPDDEDDSSDDNTDDFTFDLDDPIIKGEEDFPDIS